MRSPRDDEALLARYLLGDLTEDEQVQVEDRAFADGNYLANLEAVEADLIDAYVRGELSIEDRLRFQRLFLASASRRRKVEFARALASVTAELEHMSPAMNARRIEKPSLWEWIFGRRPALQWAGGLATVILVVSVSWLITENARVRSRVATLEAQGRETQVKEGELRRQLTEEQNRSAALNEQLQKGGGSTEGSKPFAFASLVLMPGLSRAESTTEQLTLKPADQLARIEIPLEPRDDYPRYRVELRTRSGSDVLTQAGIPKRRTSSGAAVSFDVPASALAAGDYELTLKGVGSSGSAEVIGYHYFKVKR